MSVRIELQALICPQVEDINSVAAPVFVVDTAMVVDERNPH
jgi:hypothetical protein